MSILKSATQNGSLQREGQNGLQVRLTPRPAPPSRPFAAHCPFYSDHDSQICPTAPLCG